MAEPRLCACGCGGQTPPAPRTDRRYGQVKGEPLAYIPGHNPRGKGWNLRKESKQREADDALIRHRYQAEQRPAPPEPEPEGGARLDGLSDEDRQRATWAFRELRRRHWERPLVLSDGTFALAALPDEYVLAWESEDEIVEREAPDHRRLGWWLEQSEAGLLLHGPNRLPELLDPEELLHPVEESPNGGLPEPEEPEPDEVSVEIVDGVAIVS